LAIVKLAIVAYHTARNMRRLCDCFVNGRFSIHGIGGQAGLQLGLTINGSIRLAVEQSPSIRRGVI
jgi:hypothetical protein